MSRIMKIFLHLGILNIHHFSLSEYCYTVKASAVESVEVYLYFEDTKLGSSGLSAALEYRSGLIIEYFEYLMG